MIKSFSYAISGLTYLVFERNFRLQLVLFLMVVCTGFYFNICLHDWISLFILSAMVLGAEAFNSCIEKLCDLYSSEFNARIACIKDMAAGAVLIIALCSLISGILIFWKYFF